MKPREIGFARAVEGKNAGVGAPAREFGRYSPALERPTRMEAAFATTTTVLRAAMEYGENAVGNVLWYGIGLSVMALEKAARMKKGF